MKRSAQIGLVAGGLGLAAAGGGIFASRQPACQPSPDGTQTCQPATSSSGARSHGIGSRSVLPGSTATTSPSTPQRGGFGSIGRAFSSGG